MAVMTPLHGRNLIASKVFPLFYLLIIHVKAFGLRMQRYKENDDMGQVLQKINRKEYI